MAIQSAQVTVGATTVLLATAEYGEGKVKIYITNTSATDHIWVGGANVTTSNGYEVVSSNGSTIANRQEFEVFGGESLYAITTAGKTVTVGVLTVGNN